MNINRVEKKRNSLHSLKNQSCTKDEEMLLMIICLDTNQAETSQKAAAGVHGNRLNGSGFTGVLRQGEGEGEISSWFKEAMQYLGMSPMHFTALQGCSSSFKPDQ